MRFTLLAVALLCAVFTVACSSDSSDGSDPGGGSDLGGADLGEGAGDLGVSDAAEGEGEGEGEADAAVDAGGEPLTALDQPARELAFEPPEPWAEPIADYIEVGSQSFWTFNRAVQELFLYDDRLYVGYGDANENLGRIVPIEFRAFSDPRSTEVVSEFATDEEALPRFRHLGDRLFMAGVDATEDAWLGNVYFRGLDEGWVKSRTLQGGVHVEDVALFDGTLFASGQGAQPEEWTEGNIYAHLWASTDGGQSFEIIARDHNGGEGDARFTHMLALGARLYVFGWKSNAEFLIDEINNQIYAEGQLTPVAAGDPLARILVTGTDLVPGRGGLIRGIDVNTEDRPLSVWHIDVQGQLSLITALAGQVIVDVFVSEVTGEVFFLTYDDEPLPESGFREEWQVHVWRSDDLEQLEELYTARIDLAPTSLAYWRGSLYVGTYLGAVWRSDGTPR